MRTNVRSRPAYGLWDRILRDFVEDPARNLVRSASSVSKPIFAAAYAPAYAYAAPVRGHDGPSLASVAWDFAMASKKKIAVGALAASVLILSSAETAQNGNFLQPSGASASPVATLSDTTSAAALTSRATPPTVRIDMDQAMGQLRRSLTEQAAALTLAHPVAAVTSVALPTMVLDQIQPRVVRTMTIRPDAGQQVAALSGSQAQILSSQSPIPGVTMVGSPAPVAAPTDAPVESVVRRPTTRASYDDVANYNFRRPSWTPTIFRGRRAELKAMAYAEIVQAADSVGANPTGLLTTAFLETGLDPTAKARTSTATGPFQYIEQTWLMKFKQYGGNYGYQNLADDIHVGRRNGRAYYYVNDRQTRKTILDLRKDTWTASMVTFEVMKEYQAILESAHLGRVINSSDLHICHVFGPSGGQRFLRNMAVSPNAPAHTFFDADVVAANHNVFYSKTIHRRGKPSIPGRAYTLTEVYKHYGQNFAPADRLLKAQEVSQVRTPAAETRQVASNDDGRGSQRVSFIQRAWNSVFHARPANSDTQVARAPIPVQRVNLGVRPA